MRELLSVFGFIMKIGLAFGLFFGIMGLGGFMGVCTLTDIDCTSDTTIIDTPSTDAPDSTEAPQPEDSQNDDNSNANQNDGQTEDKEPTETEKPQIEGPEPPAYPPRTDKNWDRTREFSGDPGENIAEGDNWEVSSEDVEKFVAEDVNDYREANGLDRLEYSHALASVSREHSKDMADRGYFSHKNPEGERAWDRWGSGHCRTWYGENLFQSWANAPLEAGEDYLRTSDKLAQRTLKGWQDSPPHNEAMLAKSWDVVGYGVYFVYSDDDDGSYKMYVTMNMCTYNENDKHPSDR